MRLRKPRKVQTLFKMMFGTYNIYSACVLLNFAFICSVDCQCVLPFTNGSWVTSSRGTWIIPENGTQIQNFRGTVVPSQSLYDLTCNTSSENQYILGTPGIELFPGVNIESYTCIEIQTTPSSPSKYEFYFVTDIDIATNDAFTSDMSVACDGTAIVTGSNTNIVIAEGTDGNTVKETLPNIIRGEYRLTATDQNDVTGNETQIGSCDDTSAFHVTEIANATQTISAIGFSVSGVLFNVKSFTSGNITYIYTYNNDTTVDSSTTYRFACWAVAQNAGSSIVYATVYPEVCQDGQNATHVPNGGQVLVLDPSEVEDFCDLLANSVGPDQTARMRRLIWAHAGRNGMKIPEADVSVKGGLSLVIIGLIVLGCLIVVVVVIIVIIYFIRKKKRKDLSKPLPKNTKEDEASGKKSANRPKSTSDLDSARLIDEKNKQKLAKKLANKKETRTIAVQASIWTAPIKRTTTALKATVQRSTSKESIKFIPYVDKPIIKTDQSAGPIKSATRSKTTLEKKDQDVLLREQPIERSKTTVERKRPRVVPKYLIKKNKVSSPRQKLIRQVSEFDTRSVDHYANEFEKLHPFPNEGNPNEFHNTLDIPDECKDIPCVDNESSETKEVTEKEENEKESKKETNQSIQKREYTKTSLRSRPSTTDGNLGVNVDRSGSVRKTNSAQIERSRAIMKFSYHSPYAMSESQKEYLSKKADWIRHQVKKDNASKKHFEDMKKLESQRAFDAWMKCKRKSIQSIRRKFSKNSGKTSSSSKPLEDNMKKIDQ